MSELAPRRVRVRLLTSAGWISGRLAIPAGATVLEHLNRAPTLLRLSEAGLDGHEDRVEFLAVRRETVRLVLPIESDPEQARALPGDREIAGVLPEALFTGFVRLAEGQRTSDFFATAPSFVTVRGCDLWLGTGEDATQNQSAVLAHVHVPALVAFSELREPSSA